MALVSDAARRCDENDRADAPTSNRCLSYFNRRYPHQVPQMNAMQGDNVQLSQRILEVQVKSPAACSHE